MILVNQAEGFDVAADTIGDHVHPNARGAEKMARRWFDALQRVLPPPPPMPVPEIVTYKKPGGPDLTLHIFRPGKAGPGDRPRPAILFFFGGGWKVGTPLQFYRECQFHAEHGRVAVSVDYRISSTHQTTPFESVADGKSAVRWVRRHAGGLGVDPGRITVCGASAGGQVAAAAGLVAGLDEPSEDPSVSSKPDAMILLYPVVDNGPGGYGHDLVRDRYREISPLHHIRPGAPPALIMTGTKDTTAPLAMIREFKSEMEKAGARCDLELFEGAGHPVFEYRKGGGPLRERMLDLSLKFLDSLEGPQSRE